MTEENPANGASDLRRIHRPSWRQGLHGTQPILGAWYAQSNANDGEIFRLLRRRICSPARTGAPLC